MAYKKKSLGQHFLKDKAITQNIANKIIEKCESKTIAEIGPGEGALTKLIYPHFKERMTLVELDDRFAPQLSLDYPKAKVIHKDVLKVNWQKEIGEEFMLVGNFPYNISSQILFKMLDNKTAVKSMLGMFQKEVGERVCAANGNKSYGVPTVLLGAFYEREYLFTIPPEAFDPPPKVDSAIIFLKRKRQAPAIKDFGKFKAIVKSAFGLRRKKLSNSLKQFDFEKDEKLADLLQKRPEQIDIEDFIYLAENC